MKRFTQNYNPRSTHYRDIVKADDGEYVLHSEAQARIDKLEEALREMIGSLDPKMVDAHDGGGLIALGIEHGNTCVLCKVRSALEKQP